VEQISSRYTAHYTATREFPSMLWNPKTHYRVHNSPQLVPILSHINPVITTPSHLPKTILMLSFHLCLVFSFFMAFPLKFYMHYFSLPACYMSDALRPFSFNYFSSLQTEFIFTSLHAEVLRLNSVAT
jgi:hypothetical protein